MRLCQLCLLYATILLHAACLPEFLLVDTQCDSSDPYCNPTALLFFGQLPPEIEQAVPLYPGAANWNQYILRETGVPVGASGAACNPGGDLYGSCIHAGLMRSATLRGSATCADLVLSDSLNALHWYCDESTGERRAISTGLRPGVPLSTLIDFTTGSFRPLQVIATTVGPVPLSNSGPAEVLWDNPIVIDNDGIAPGVATSGTIYLVTQNTNALYTIDSDSVGLVMQPGLVMSGTAAASESIVVVNGANFAWIEATINMSGDSHGVNFTGAGFSVARNIRVRNCTTAASMIVVTTASRSNFFSDVRLADAGNCVGIQIDGTSPFSVFDGLNLAGSTTNQIRLQTNSRRNTFMNLTAFTAGANNIGNILVEDTAVLNATLAGSGSRGFTATGASNQLLVHNVAALNHTFSGFDVQNPNTNTFVNLAGAHNDQNGVIVLGNNNQFRGVLRSGNNAVQDCNVAGGTAPGLIANTCTDSGLNGSNTYTGQNSDAVLTRGIDLSNSFVGPVGVDDSANISDLAGLQTFSSIGDFLDFENEFRGWSISASGPTDAGLRTACAGASLCRIYDWSLLSGDTQLRAANAIVSSGATTTHSFQGAVETPTFLNYAVEIVGDGIGNENGFCESFERCLYSPNIGAYQGHGDLIELGTVATDTVTGVELVGYAINGR